MALFKIKLATKKPFENELEEIETKPQEFEKALFWYEALKELSTLVKVEIKEIKYEKQNDFIHNMKNQGLI